MQNLLSSPEIVSAAFAHMALLAITSQAANTRRRLQPASTASIAGVVFAANTAPSASAVAGARPGDLFLRHGEEATETVAHHDTLAGLAAKAALRPLRAETARCTDGGKRTAADGAAATVASLCWRGDGGHDPFELVNTLGEDFEGLVECAVVCHGGSEDAAHGGVTRHI